MNIPYLWLIYGGILIALSSSCNNNKNPGSASESDVYSIETFMIDSSGWGYDIYKNNKPFIHQPNIPSINKMTPFETEETARKTAQLVIKKLNNNEFPPSLSKEEVDSLIK